MFQVARQYVVPGWWGGTWYPIEFEEEENDMPHFSGFGDPAWLTVTDIKGNGSQWALQILEVAEEFEGVGYVAGGAARFLVVEGAPEPADIDVFLYGGAFDYEPLLRLGYEPSELGPPWAPFFERDEGELKVQVVRPDVSDDKRVSHGTPLEVLSRFTFHTEQAAIWYGAGGAAGLLSVLGRESTEERILSNNSISNALLSMYRLNKYGRKGYVVSMESVMEIANTLRRLTDDQYNETIVDALSMES